MRSADFDAVARRAQQQASAVAALAKAIGALRYDVDAAIAGTSTGQDRGMQQKLDEAQRRSERSAQAFAQAAREARRAAEKARSEEAREEVRRAQAARKGRRP